MSRLVATWREKQVKTCQQYMTGSLKVHIKHVIQQCFSQSSTPNSDATITNLGLNIYWPCVYAAIHISNSYQQFIYRMCPNTHGHWTSNEMLWVHPKKSPWLIWQFAIEHGYWNSWWLPINSMVMFHRFLGLFTGDCVYIYISFGNRTWQLEIQYKWGGVHTEINEHHLYLVTHPA